MATKNLGQVAGVHVGTSAPSNTILIWYDSTPSIMAHKVYDSSTGEWVLLDQNIISSITYSEITTAATNNGLSVGSMYRITDLNNVLAMAISSTKVFYTDTVGNIIVDDLGTNTQYHVTSSNLTIDGVTAEFDEDDNTLDFLFDEVTPEPDSGDYVLGKVQRGTGSAWSLAKFALSSFVSSVTGNSLSWNGGLYFSFSNAMSALYDIAGGMVSYNTFNTKVQELEQSISNVAKENQTIISNADETITAAVTDDEIYSKKLPSITTSGEAIDIAKGDTLLAICSKIQRYINKYKYADGIKLTSSYSYTGTSGSPNNNDTVNSAIAKLHRMLTEVEGTLYIAEDFEPYSDYYQAIEAGDEYSTALAKIEADRRRIIDIETAKQAVTVDVYTSSDSGLVSTTTNVDFRIHDGILEIYLYEVDCYVYWIYTRTLAEDTHRFFAVNFDSELLEKLKEYVSIPTGTTYSYIPLSEIGTLTVNAVYSSSGSWEESTELIQARLCFGYYIGATEGSITFGFILMPLTCMQMSSSSSETEEDSVKVITVTVNTKCVNITSETTFYDLNSLGYRFLLPKILMQYSFV